MNPAISMAAERHVYECQLKGFVDSWTNESGERRLPHDFVWGGVWIDVKCSDIPNLHVRESWLKRRVEQAPGTRLILVHWDRRPLPDPGFRTKGWIEIRELLRRGTLDDRGYRNMPAAQLRPMRTFWGSP